MISAQLRFDINNEILIDNFAVGGCASTGIECHHGLMPLCILRHIMR